MPIVADRATASATMAMPVRDNPEAMPATAMRAAVPPSLPASGAASLEASRTNKGTQSAKPRINRKTAARPATRLVPEAMINATAATMPATPVSVTAGSACRARCSITERVSASRGRYEVASSAGTAAATSAAPTPARSPLATENGLTATSVTLTRK
jgi:hypothetical protein